MFDNDKQSERANDVLQSLKVGGYYVGTVDFPTGPKGELTTIEVSNFSLYDILGYSGKEWRFVDTLDSTTDDILKRMLGIDDFYEIFSKSCGSIWEIKAKTKNLIFSFCINTWYLNYVEMGKTIDELVMTSYDALFKAPSILTVDPKPGDEVSLLASVGAVVMKLLSKALEEFLK